MKAEVQPFERPFSPITLTLTLETQDEIDCLYALGNSGKLASVIMRAWAADNPLYTLFDALARFEVNGAERTNTLGAHINP